MSSKVLSNEMVSKIQAAFGVDLEVKGEQGAQELLVTPERLLELMEVLKNNDGCQLNMLRNVTAVDYKEYIEMVYHLYSLTLRHNATVKMRCAADNGEVPSITTLWPSANFQEREVYDLMGVRFAGHPDLRRILMPEEYTEHPLRKSFSHGNRSGGRN